MTPAWLIASAAGLTIIGNIAAKRAPSPRVFVGAAVAGAGFLALAQVQPELATKLAAVALITALLTSGYDVAQGVTRALGQPQPTATQAATGD